MPKVAVILLQIASRPFLLLLGSCSDVAPEISFSLIMFTNDNDPLKSESTGFKPLKDSTSNPDTQEDNLSFPVKIEGFNTPIYMNLSILPVNIFKDSNSDKLGDYYLIKADFTAYNAALKDDTMFMREFTVSLQPTDVNGNSIPGIKFCSEPTPTTTIADSHSTELRSNTLNANTFFLGIREPDIKLFLDHVVNQYAVTPIEKVSPIDGSIYYQILPSTMNILLVDRLYVYTDPADGVKYMYTYNMSGIPEHWFKLSDVPITPVFSNDPIAHGFLMRIDPSLACQPPHIIGSKYPGGPLTEDYGPIMDVQPYERVVSTLTVDEMKNSIFLHKFVSGQYAAISHLSSTNVFKAMKVPISQSLIGSARLNGSSWSINRDYYPQDLSTILNTNSADSLSSKFKVENIDSENDNPSVLQSGFNGYATWVLKMPIDKTELTHDQFTQTLFNFKVELLPLCSELAHKDRLHVAYVPFSPVKIIS